MFALDLETAPTSGDLSNGYALEPWRARRGQAKISSMAIMGEGYATNIPHPTRDQLVAELTKLAGKEVYCHNTIFDVAWLIASIEPNKFARIPECVSKIRWRDTMLLTKWVVNGRQASDMHLSYSLMNLVATFFKGQPGVEEFIAMKMGSTLDPNSEYWLRRGMLDVEWTLKLAELMYGKLPEVCRRGYVIEAHSIAQLANSWLIGMGVNEAELQKASDHYHKVVKDGCASLGINESVASSSHQLADLLFNRWGLAPLGHTATGKAKTDADSLKLIEFNTQDKRLIKLMEVRQAQTLISKYVKTTYEALGRTGHNCIYASPKMFGTDTGRLTYSNETLKGVKVSIAAHQIPRKDKLVRKFLTAPEGAKICRLDANAQESRIMAIWSNDENMIKIFNEGMNFHSYMAANITGRAYLEFMQQYDAGDASTNEMRQLGKLVNLSCNFRIGGKSLSTKSFTEYDRWMTETEGRQLVNLFKRTYPGIPAYWNSIIEFARQNGYSYTLAQRRYKVPLAMLNSSDAWKVEGTIISHPIQGTAGEQFYAMLSQVPEARVITTLHDATYFIVDDEQEGLDIARRANSTPYDDLWALDKPLPVKLPYDCSFGFSFADIK
jgi:DNA polymerase I-like protein with 3'-5' exonuclease and polymerase domains